MGAGELDQRVIIAIRAVTLNELGEEVASWVPLDAGRFARVMEPLGRAYVAGGEGLDAGQIVAEERIAVKLRWIEIDPTARLDWRGRRFEIERVTGSFKEGFTWLHCRGIRQDA